MFKLTSRSQGEIGLSSFTGCSTSTTSPITPADFAAAGGCAENKVDAAASPVHLINSDRSTDCF